MSLSDELRAERLRRLHTRFLDASGQYPNLNHVACRSDHERLWIAMSPAWLHSAVDESHEKTHKEFWQEAAGYGRYGQFCYGPFVSPTHVVRVNETIWIGRFSDADPEQWEENALGVFASLSDEAVENFLDPVKPPMTINGPRDALEIGVNPWLNTLYGVFSHKPERWDYHPGFPGPMKPGETYLVIGLPCNVFLASARAIEVLIERKCALPDWVADSKTDSGESAAVRVPDNPDVLRLAKKIRSERKSGATMKDIAMDFTDGDEAKAKSLLRQVRRYRSLLR